MTREEHKKITNQLLQMVAPEHQAAASEMLVQLSEDYGTTQDDLDKANATAATATEQFEALRKVNADLFLKVGQTIPTAKTETQNNDEPSDEPLSYDALFDEKGDLI